MVNQLIRYAESKSREAKKVLTLEKPYVGSGFRVPSAEF